MKRLKLSSKKYTLSDCATRWTAMIRDPPRTFVSRLFTLPTSSIRRLRGEVLQSNARGLLLNRQRNHAAFDTWNRYATEIFSADQQACSWCSSVCNKIVVVVPKKNSRSRFERVEAGFRISCSSWQLCMCFNSLYTQKNAANLRLHIPFLFAVPPIHPSYLHPSCRPTQVMA